MAERLDANVLVGNVRTSLQESKYVLSEDEHIMMGTSNWIVAERHNRC